jgi:hypothetical protein
LQQFFGVAVKKPKVPDPSKSFGQNMLEDEMKKIFSFEGAIADFAGFAFRIHERNPAILISDDILFTDDAPI